LPRRAITEEARYTLTAILSREAGGFDTNDYFAAEADDGPLGRFSMHGADMMSFSRHGHGGTLGIGRAFNGRFR
jgi:hypothetical protein